MVWKPRASKIGTYTKCLWRAVQDRLFDEGRLPADIAERMVKDPTMYADFGTVCHFFLQDGLRCQWPRRAPRRATKPAEKDELLGVLPHFNGDVAAATAAFESGDARAYQPTPDEWTNASAMCGNDLAATRQQAERVAQVAARCAPKANDGRPWLAEHYVENEYTHGHLDFLAQNGSEGGDLKTTSKPPTMAKLKYDHLCQITAYHLLTGVQRMWVLYVDSVHASWALLVWVDFTTPKMQFYAEQIAGFCRFLMSDQLFDVAWPALGDHCGRTWCPYRADCHDSVMPASGRVINAAMLLAPAAPVRLAPLGAPPTARPAFFR